MQGLSVREVDRILFTADPLLLVQTGPKMQCLHCFVVAKLTRDLTSAISRNDNEVQELQAIIKQNRINAEHELERRVYNF